MTANPIRGEATVKIAGKEYTLAVTMESLGQLSNFVGDPPFGELYGKLMGTSIYTVRMALGLFVQSSPDCKSRKEAANAAVAGFSLADLAAVQDAMVKILTALTREPGDDGDKADPQNAASA